MKNAPQWFLKTSLSISWLIIGLSLVGIGLYTFVTPYEDFTTTLLQAVHKLDWKPYFQHSVFPLSRYQFLPYLLGLFFSCWLLLSPFFFQKVTSWSSCLQVFLKESLKEQKSFWQRRSRSEYLALSGIISLAFIRMLYYLQHYALQYDEAWTYNHFIANGFLVSAISPNNNHIFYTLWACLSDLLPISGQYSLRIPVVIGGLFLLLVFYKSARENSSHSWALLGLSFLAFAPAASLYSLYARGYIFQMLFTVLAVGASLKIVNPSQNTTYHWAWWCIAHILGMYSVPTHAYVLLLLSVFLLWKGARNFFFLKKWALANILILMVVGFLYLPYLLTNGGAILWRAASEGPSGEALWSYQDKVADWLLWGGGRGTAVYGIWLFGVSVLFLCYWKWVSPSRKGPSIIALIELTLLFLLFPTLLNLTTGSQPPYRVWCFLGPFWAWWITIVGQTVAPNWKNSKSLLGAIILMITTYSWRLEQHYALQWSASLDWQVKTIATQLLEADVDTCYLFSNYDKPLLEYYYLRQGNYLKIAMVAPNSKDFAPFEQLPLYEAVLWDKEDRTALPQEKSWLQAHYPILIYQDNRVEVRLPSAESTAPAN